MVIDKCTLLNNIIPGRRIVIKLRTIFTIMTGVFISVIMGTPINLGTGIGAGVARGVSVAIGIRRCLNQNAK